MYYMRLRNYARITFIASFLLIIASVGASLLGILPSRMVVLLAGTLGLIVSALGVLPLQKAARNLLMVITLASFMAIGIQLAGMDFVGLNPTQVIVASILLTVGSTLSYFYQGTVARVIGSQINLGAFIYLNISYLNISTPMAITYFSLLSLAPAIYLVALKLNLKKILLGPLVLILASTFFFFLTWGKAGLLNEGRDLILVSGFLFITILILANKVIFTKQSTVLSLMFFALLVGMVPSINGLSSNSFEKVVSTQAANKRSAEVSGYRLPGVGYKDELRGKTFKECDEGNTVGRDCFITLYVDLAKEKGVDAALKDAIDAVNNNRGTKFAAHCHQVTHAIGQFAAATDYKDKPIDGLKLEPQICATGYTHGVFEAYWKPISTPDLLVKTPEACKDLGMDKGFYRWTCNHILGHVLVQRDELNPGPQLRSCLKIPDEHSANDCLSGGWMQFFSDDPILAMFKAKNATYTDIFKYCNDEPLQSQRMCYQETFPSLSIIRNSNFTTEMSDCKNATDETNMIWCIQGVARAIAITGGYTVKFAKEECAKVEAGMIRDYCYTASAASITLNAGIITETRLMCDLVLAKDVNAYCKRWVRDSRKLISSGPNSQNIPKF